VEEFTHRIFAPGERSSRCVPNDRYAKNDAKNLLPLRRHPITHTRRTKMNSLIFHIALLLEGLVHRLRRLGFGRVLSAFAVAAPLTLLVYAVLRYGDAVARARFVVIGFEQIVVALLAAMVVRAAFALLFEPVATRLHRSEARETSALT
jgi:hypothetical protein